MDWISESLVALLAPAVIVTAAFAVHVAAIGRRRAQPAGEHGEGDMAGLHLLPTGDGREHGDSRQMRPFRESLAPEHMEALLSVRGEAGAHEPIGLDSPIIAKHADTGGQPPLTSDARR